MPLNLNFKNILEFGKKKPKFEILCLAFVCFFMESVHILLKSNILKKILFFQIYHKHFLFFMIIQKPNDQASKG